MKKIFSSFYARLAVVFLILLLIMGTISMLISSESSISFVKEADQRLNADLAKSIALEFQPYIKDSINIPGIEHMIHYLMVMNPHIEIYLLDSTGRIKTFFAVPADKVKRKSVDLGPVRKFIRGHRTETVYGDDPRNLDREKPFSAAPIQLNDSTGGYIYVILGGEQYDSAEAALKEGFLVSTAAKGLIVALVFTAIIGLILFFLMTRRLSTVTETVAKFKEGDFSRRLPEKSDDDFGQLARTFNRMADTIVSNMNELKRTDDLRRELIANVSHDLRSPLAAIQGYLETIQIKKDTLTDEQLQKYLEISLHNTEDLNRLVGELFELSKLDARQIEPKIEVFSISELVQDVVMKFRHNAKKREINVRADLEKRLPPVKGDIGMIERVLSNLLENAIKFAPVHGKVDIVPSSHDRAIRIEVSDNGPGIAPEDIPHIFSRYYRGKRTGTDARPGTGLGLAIAQKILELHKSAIKVDSKPNVGTTFYFDLKTA